MSNLIIKSDTIGWLQNAVKIPKQFKKLKSDLRFIIYVIHVFTDMIKMENYIHEVNHIISFLHMHNTFGQ